MTEPTEQDRELARLLMRCDRSHEDYAVRIAAHCATERAEAERSEKRAIMWEDRWQKKDEELFTANMLYVEAQGEIARLTAELDQYRSAFHGQQYGFPTKPVDIVRDGKTLAGKEADRG